jgi:hypothetical protein
VGSSKRAVFLEKFREAALFIVSHKKAQKAQKEKPDIRINLFLCLLCLFVAPFAGLIFFVGRR